MVAQAQGVEGERGGGSHPESRPRWGWGGTFRADIPQAAGAPEPFSGCCPPVLPGLWPRPGSLTCTLPGEVERLWAIWAGGSHSVSCSAVSPEEDPSEEAEPVVEAEPEVRRAGQGGEGARALGRVLCAVSP